MTIGSFWRLDDPPRPWGLMGPRADLSFPIDISAWLDGLGGSYTGHEVRLETPLELVSAVHAAGVVTVRIRRAEGAAFVQGAKYPFTLRIVCSAGADERTFWLKLQDR